MDSSCEMDICKVCHQEGKPEQPLFHPCLCAGSIKYIHQECLLMWMKHSKTSNCALCNHHYSFITVYAPDMPQKLSMLEIATYAMFNSITIIKHWLNWVVVIMLWVLVLPILLYRIRQCLFQSSFDALKSLPVDVLSPIIIITDFVYGCLIMVFITFVIFKLKWLQERIREYSPDWLVISEPGQAPQIFVAIHSNFEENLDEEVEQEILQENNDDLNQGNLNLNDPWNTEEIISFFGLDGSLEFLRYYLIVMVVNTSFISMFEVFPYKFGFLLLKHVDLQNKFGLQYFERILTTLCGYYNISVCLLLIFSIATIFRWSCIQYKIAIIYINIKVFMVSVVEIVVLPIAFGWWLDVCSLPLFDTTLNDLIARFHSAPYTSMFVHWLLFVPYLCYFHWFLELIPRTINLLVPSNLQMRQRDNFFIKACIRSSTLQVARNFIMLIVVFGTAIFLTVWIPVYFLKFIWPSFLPCYGTFNIDIGYGLIIIEIFIFLFAFTFLRIMHQPLNDRIKLVVGFWFIAASDLLGIKTYLFGDGDRLLLRNARPTYFAIRLIVLSIMALLCIIIINLAVIIIPVLLGRLIMLCWTTLVLDITKLFELLTINMLCAIVCGLFITLLLLKGVRFLVEPERRFLMINSIKFWILIFSKIIFTFILLTSLLLSILFLREPSDLPVFVINYSATYLIARYIYLILMPMVIMFIISLIIIKTMRLYKKLYIYVKDEKYLVGKLLLNYDQTNTVSL